MVIVSFVPIILWMALMLSSASIFQNQHNVDPLAMINVLFPFYWIILFILIIISLFVLFRYSESEILHIQLLSEIAIVLFVTPFVLSGFSWSPDSLFHGGVASYMPEILSGQELAYSNYPQSYPLSYLLTFSVEKLFGLSVFQYTLYVYPLFCSIFIAILGYAFVNRLLGPKNAFLALLITLPTLHFVEPHVSPFSTGTLIILAAFVLTTVKSQKARLGLLSLMFVSVWIHPISPLTLGIFLLFIIFVKFFAQAITKNTQILSNFEKISTNVSWRSVIILMIVWLSWTIFYVYNMFSSISYAITRILSLRFLTYVDRAAEFTSGGFIYPEIFQLNIFIYAIMAFSSLFFLLYSLRNLLVDKIDNFTGLELLFSSLSLIYAAYSYFLFLGSGEHVLLGRGLIFFTLISSIPLSRYLLKISKKMFFQFAKYLIIVCLLFGLFFTFPIVSYSKEAYNTYTPSSDAGLSFISDNLNLTSRSISMSADQQLASYVDLRKGISATGFPPDLNTNFPDYVVLRINFYFVVSMRYELDFENNSYTRLDETLSSSAIYDKIYSTGLFEIFSRNR